MIPGAVLVMIIWQLDLQLPMQLVTIVVSSNPTHSQVYLIQRYVIKFVSDLRQAIRFLRILRFPLSTKLTAMI